MIKVRNFKKILIVFFGAFVFYFNNHFVAGTTYYQGDLRSAAKTRSNESDAAKSEFELAEFLFANYSPACRPRRDAGQVIPIALGMSFYALNEIVERTHEIIVTASLTVQWWDEFLIWDNTSFGHIELLAYPNTKIWLPDIALTNSGDLYAFMQSRGMMAVIHSDGAVEYFPEATVTTFCQFDLTYFPFDVQVCEFKLESWSYIISQQTFHLVTPPINTLRFGANEQWDLIDTHAGTYLACYNYTVTRTYCYPGAVFRLMLQRKSDYYTIMIIVPSIIFSVVELVAFSLPLAEVSKLQITFTCLLSYAVFQTTVRSDMPRTSDHDPLLSIYFDMQMAYIAFALCGEACVFLVLQQAFKTKKVPTWLRRLLFIPRISEVDKHSELTLTTDNGCSPALNNTRASLAEVMDAAALHPQRYNRNRKESMCRFPSRDIISRHIIEQSERLTEQEDEQAANTTPLSTSSNGSSAARSPNHRETLPRAEQRKWELVASRLEVIVMVVYALAISLTPLFMFHVARVFDSMEELNTRFRAEGGNN